MASNETPRSRKSSAAAAPLPPEKDVKCPRCDSPNTKFCYYNNYSLTQPRHFCKTCRRYWTKGGALRNVPVGGGCRRNKKTKSSSSSSSLSLSMDPYDPISSSNGCLKFLTGLSPSPVTDFHLSLSRFQYSPSFPVNYPSAIGFYNHEMGGPSGNGNENHSSLACTIESLSSINQDMHLKLQQQRMESMLFGDHGNQKAQPSFLGDQQDPMSFDGTESSRADSIAWFLGGSCAVNPDMINGSSVGNNDIVDNDNNGNWNGISAWSDVHHYPALP